MASLAPKRSHTRDSDSSVERRSGYALAVALAMLVINLVGFGPTLYLRPFFDVPDIPLYLFVHGAVGTAWFTFVVLQTALIANRHVSLHQKVGWVGVGLACAVLIMGIYTSSNMVARANALGKISEADITLYSLVTAADLAAFIVFPTLVGLAVWFRRRRDVHRRFMLIASMSILGPAITRIGSWFGDVPNPMMRIILFGFLISLVIHDIKSRRRPHMATVFGLTFLITVNLSMQLSGIGGAIVESRLQ